MLEFPGIGYCRLGRWRSGDYHMWRKGRSDYGMSRQGNRMNASGLSVSATPPLQKGAGGI